MFKVFLGLCRSSVQKENFNPNVIYWEGDDLETSLNDVADCCYGKPFGAMMSPESYNSQTTSVSHIRFHFSLVVAYYIINCQKLECFGIQNTFLKILMGHIAYISLHFLYFEKCVSVFLRHFSRIL